MDNTIVLLSMRQARDYKLCFLNIEINLLGKLQGTAFHENQPLIMEYQGRISPKFTQPLAKPNQSIK